MIAIYKPCGVLKDAAGNVLDQFKAVGYGYIQKKRWYQTAAGHDRGDGT